MNSLDPFTVLSIILGFFSIILSLYAIKKSNRPNKLVFLNRTTKIISKQDYPFEKLTFEYDGQQIHDLVATKYSIWNYGRKEIKTEEMIKTDSLRIESIDDTIIYDVQIETINEHNQVNAVMKSTNEIRLNFLYLNSSDGILVNVFHSGINSKGLKLMGSFLGTEEITPVPKKNKYTDAFINLRCFNIFQKIIDSVNYGPLKAIVIIATIFFSMPIMLIGFIFIAPFDFINDYWEKRIPKKLMLK